VLVSALVGGTLLRVGARVFLGAGARAPEDALTHGDPGEADTERRTSMLLWGPAALLAVGAVAWGVVPGVSASVARGAATFTGAASVPHVAVEPQAWLYAIASTLLAAGVAATALSGRAQRAPAGARTALRRVRELHSGRIGDEVAWMAAGFAAIATALVLAVA
jgi:multicomponent Na+:H+ antiporter subunit D